MNDKQIIIGRALLNLAGEVFKMKYEKGLNISAYVAEVQEGDAGLLKIKDLAYRGDANIPDRSARMFYSLEKDSAVILDAMKQKSEVWKEVPADSNHVVAFGGNPSLAWVYAIPVLKNDEVTSVICFTGSYHEDFANDSFKKDVADCGKLLVEGFSFV